MAAFSGFNRSTGRTIVSPVRRLSNTVSGDRANIDINEWRRRRARVTQERKRKSGELERARQERIRKEQEKRRRERMRERRRRSFSLLTGYTAPNVVAPTLLPGDMPF